MKIQNTSNITLNKINIAVIGPSKSGKTSLASTIKGKVLICNADKGVLSLAGSSLQYITVTTWTEFVEFMKYVTSSKDFVAKGFDWVVFDSVSAIASILKEHLDEKGVTGFDFWGDYEKLIGGILKTTRDTDRFNSLAIFELLEKENENGLLEKKFGIQGSLASKVPYFFDFVFATKKIDSKKDKPEQYVIQTTNKGGYNCLGSRGVTLNEFEPSNIQHVIKKLKGVK